jgi:hypothetical protein
MKLLLTPHFGRVSAPQSGDNRRIATTSPGLPPCTTIGLAIDAKGCPSQAGVNGVGPRADFLDIVEGAANLDCELLVGIDGHHRRRASIDPEEGIRSDLSSCAAPLCVEDAGRDASTRARDGEVRPMPP